MTNSISLKLRLEYSPLPNISDEGPKKPPPNIFRSNTKNNEINVVCCFSLTKGQCSKR